MRTSLFAGAPKPPAIDGCLGCGAPPEVGTLCTGCADSLTVGVMTPEQIVSAEAEGATAALVDRWGRPHRLLPRTLVGRQPHNGGLVILEASVSRMHAIISAREGGFVLRDAQSTNGTTVNGHVVVGDTPLAAGDCVSFGDVPFLFAATGVPLRDFDLDEEVRTTLRPIGVVRSAAPSDRTVRYDSRRTGTEQEAFSMALAEPTTGGGGILVLGGVELQLTLQQFELVRLLLDRLAAEGHQPRAVRGYVRAHEIMATLSWDTAAPSEEHVKQLVRRVRRLLVAAGLSNVIEARRGFGYRLHPSVGP